MPFGRGVFDDKSTISAIQGFKFKNNYEIRNLREILHNICANVKMLHGHFKRAESVEIADMYLDSV